MSRFDDTDAFETRVVHAGQDPDPATGAVVPALSLASTFAQDAVSQHRGYEYARTGNPTRAALERCVSSLEGAGHGLAFASGMAAEDAVLRLLLPGDHVIIPTDAYGGTYRLVSSVYGPAGIEWSAVDLTDPDALAAAWRDETRLVWIETPTNPLLTIVDITAVADLVHDRGALVVVDNTFATPYLQQPLALGADVVGGFVAVDDDDLAQGIAYLQNAAGAVPGPFDCYLVLRGVRTLAVRMDRHCENARAVAALLAEHPAVTEVRYPGLPGHPGHDIARRQMRAYGGIVSFTCAGGADGALKVAASTRIFTLAESLGAVESLIEHPARMTHASATGSPLAVDAALVRLSVGIENPVDLVADLKQALDAAE